MSECRAVDQVDDGQTVSACCRCRRRARLLRDGARRRRRHGAPVHGGLRATISRVARHRHAPLPVSVHGERFEAPGFAQGRARDGPRGGRGSVAAVPDLLALVAGGRSFGGRMTSQAQAASPLPASAASRSLDFRCIPRVSRRTSVASTSPTVQIPMLFLQGTRDELADLLLLRRRSPRRLGARATLELFDDADHSFHVPARTGRKDARRPRRNGGRAGGLDREDARSRPGRAT